MCWLLLWLQFNVIGYCHDINLVWLWLDVGWLCCCDWLVVMKTLLLWLIVLLIWLLWLGEMITQLLSWVHRFYEYSYVDCCNGFAVVINWLVVMMRILLQLVAIFFQMQISLKGNVVILDEAHNIEDSAREAASQSLTQDSILKAMWDIESLSQSYVCLPSLWVLFLPLLLYYFELSASSRM